jgi:hypothetical protein
MLCCCLLLSLVAWKLAGAEEIPRYVLDYAPVFHLHSDERHWPSDVGVHLQHVTPKLDGVDPIASAPSPLTLDNIDDAPINRDDVFLTSNDDPAARPQADWITSEYGKPDATGYSAAPAYCLLVNKRGLVRDNRARRRCGH